jgi:hypothetical protein
MSAALLLPTDLPPPAAADQPSGAARLLSLVRKLIDYGRALAASIQPGSPASDIADARSRFGTNSIALILARITRGLLRATALASGLERGKARLDLARRPNAAFRMPRSPRPPRPAAERVPLDSDDAHAILARLPTPAQIANEILHRPAGAVLVDICIDLGVTTDNPLWREITELIIPHGGNYATLATALVRTITLLPDPGPDDRPLAVTPPPGPRTPAPAATGPP